mmetsp:Transcript_3059/g.9522  ORF Transcript_3059/g.9522 Transcript_3059/m.9522 type:complete len:158 (-) Transcript_3059:128-601(-)
MPRTTCAAARRAILGGRPDVKDDCKCLSRRLISSYERDDVLRLNPERVKIRHSITAYKSGVTGNCRDLRSIAWFVYGATSEAYSLSPANLVQRRQQVSTDRGLFALRQQQGLLAARCHALWFRSLTWVADGSASIAVCRAALPRGSSTETAAVSVEN